MKKTIATVISRVFEPQILLPIVFIACAYHIGVSLLTSLFWLMIMVVPTIGYRLWMREKQKIDWDIHDRKRRVKPLSLLFGFLGIMCVLIRIFEPRLFPFLLLFLVWTLGFFAITTWVTKISGHVGGDTLATGMIIHWFGWVWWPILLIVPLVGWARIVRKDHTFVQVIAGAVYSWILLIVFR